MICTALKDLYYVEWFVLRWMICTTLSDLYYVEWFVLRWKIWTTLNDLYSVELFAQSWIICSTGLNDLYYVEWALLRWMICITLNDFLLRCKICTTSNDLYSQGIIQRWKICTTLNDSECDGWFVQRWIIWTRWIIEYQLFNECQVYLFEKILSDILHLPWVDFFLILTYLTTSWTNLTLHLFTWCNYAA